MWGRLVLAALVVSGLFAAAGNAMLPWVFVEVTPAGPAPKVVRAVAGSNLVAWYGAGMKGRQVVFPDGSCRAQVAAPAGERRGCVFRRPGRHVYRIQGLPGAGVVVVRAG